jgi:N6-L-threonylcarbamoyladenine synthase
MVGLSFGKAMALALRRPLIAVNHLEGHAVSARLTADLPYPFLLLLVSGGHCQLLEVAGVGACVRLGSTIDDAAGPLTRSAAHSAFLSRRAGAGVDGARRRRRPGSPCRVLLGREGCDFSFSGPEDRRRPHRRAPHDRSRPPGPGAAVQAAIARQLAEPPPRHRCL